MCNVLNHILLNVEKSLILLFVHGKWQEFEMETWDMNGMKSIVGAHAFTTSQSRTILQNAVSQTKHVLSYGTNMKDEGFNSVIDAMYSLAWTDMDDLQPIYDIINGRTEKAKAWLKDKLNAKFVIPAINQCQSQIALNIW
ncbi:hypothetical protein BDQ17DRAFT_1337156 [Cyathus striatus]|nr:hypothetical protein BDQ17DRAFT_1337156 [Cyathus striatus]